MNWDDLIGIPYSEADCRAIVKRGLERLGLVVPMPQLWAGTPATLAGVSDYLAKQAGQWTLVGGWPVPILRDGDVILSLPDSDGLQSAHLSLVIDGAKGEVLTTSAELGSCRLRVWVLGSPKSVWRLA